MAERPVHPDLSELSAYVDDALGGERRARVEAHLAACDACRAEVTAAAALVRSAPASRRFRLPIGLAAAATLAVLLVPRLGILPRFAPAFREPGDSLPVPALIGPRGDVAEARRLVWSPVPGADRYRVTLLDSAGTALWRLETVDTAAALPDSLGLRPGVPYFWKVDAETGFDRWSSSELIDFSVGPRR